MGACASIHKNPCSPFKFSFRPKTHDDKFMIPSPVKDKDDDDKEKVMEKEKLPSNIKTDDLTFISFQPASSFVRDFVSKEETFFDTQPWLESDCDDDFYSVNGSEFTPSRGSTPVHHSFSVGTRTSIQLNRADFEEKMSLSVPIPSPKKRLSELFQESSDDEQEVRNQYIAGDQKLAEPNSTDVNPTSGDLSTPKSPEPSPYFSGSGATSVRSSERTPNGNIKKGKERSLKTVQCCIPRLLPTNLSFTEGKKSISPA